MEWYIISKEDFKNSIKTARCVASITERPVLFHWFDCLFCNFRYGCSPNQYLNGSFYKLRSFDRKRTYTKQRIHTVAAKYNNKSYTHILGNKVEFNKHFASFIKRNWLFCKDSTLAEINLFVETNKKVIVKPINKNKGKGIHVLAKGEDVSSFVGKDILLEEYIVQHQNMCFNNKSVNTLRIITILDSVGETHVIKAGFRCGLGEAVVDNYSAGGLAYPINIDLGIIEGPGGNNTLGQNVFVHPGSNIIMVGREIPFWNEAITVVKEAARLQSFPDWLLKQVLK